MLARTSSPVFNYRALRLFMGIIAIALAPIVSGVASEPLASVSASYHTDARDVFVGMLLIVATFLWMYNGHRINEAFASKVAGLAASLVAIFPTSCANCAIASNSTFHWEIGPAIHWVAAATLFAILAYFCFGPFRQNTKAQGGKKGRRSKIYFACGCVMIACMLFGLIAKLTMTSEAMDVMSITYWVEAIALSAFGVAWIVSGKVLRLLTDDQDVLQLRIGR